MLVLNTNFKWCCTLQAHNLLMKCKKNEENCETKIDYNLVVNQKVHAFTIKMFRIKTLERNWYTPRCQGMSSLGSSESTKLKEFYQIEINVNPENKKIIVELFEVFIKQPKFVPIVFDRIKINGQIKESIFNNMHTKSIFDNVNNELIINYINEGSVFNNNTNKKPIFDNAFENLFSPKDWFKINDPNSVLGFIPENSNGKAIEF